MKFIVKKVLPDYKWQWKSIASVVTKILRKKIKIQALEKNKQNSLMLLSNCAICGKKKLTFIKN